MPPITRSRDKNNSFKESLLGTTSGANDDPADKRQPKKGPKKNEKEINLTKRVPDAKPTIAKASKGQPEATEGDAPPVKRGRGRPRKDGKPSIPKDVASAPKELGDAKEDKVLDKKEVTEERAGPSKKSGKENAKRIPDDIPTITKKPKRQADATADEAPPATRPRDDGKKSSRRDAASAQQKSGSKGYDSAEKRAEDEEPASFKPSEKTVKKGIFAFKIPKKSAATGEKPADKRGEETGRSNVKIPEKTAQEIYKEKQKLSKERRRREDEKLRNEEAARKIALKKLAAKEHMTKIIKGRSGLRPEDTAERGGDEAMYFVSRQVNRSRSQSRAPTSVGGSRDGSRAGTPEPMDDEKLYRKQQLQKFKEQQKEEEKKRIEKEKMKEEKEKIKAAQVPITSPEKKRTAKVFMRETRDAGIVDFPVAAKKEEPVLPGGILPKKAEQSTSRKPQFASTSSTTPAMQLAEESVAMDIDLSVLPPANPTPAISTPVPMEIVQTPNASTILRPAQYTVSSAALPPQQVMPPKKQTGLPSIPKKISDPRLKKISQVPTKNPDVTSPNLSVDQGSSASSKIPDSSLKTMPITPAHLPPNIPNPSPQAVPPPLHRNRTPVDDDDRSPSPDGLVIDERAAQPSQTRNHNAIPSPPSMILSPSLTEKAQPLYRNRTPVSDDDERSPSPLGDRLVIDEESSMNLHNRRDGSPAYPRMDDSDYERPDAPASPDPRPADSDDERDDFDEYEEHPPNEPDRYRLPAWNARMTDHELRKNQAKSVTYLSDICNYLRWGAADKVIWALNWKWDKDRSCHFDRAANRLFIFELIQEDDEPSDRLLAGLHQVICWDEDHLNDAHRIKQAQLDYLHQHSITSLAVLPAFTAVTRKTPLSEAVNQNKIEWAEFLIKHGASINDKVLYRTGNDELECYIIQLALNNSPDNAGEDFHLINLLLAYGANRAVAFDSLESMKDATFKENPGMSKQEFKEKVPYYDKLHLLLQTAYNSVCNAFKTQLKKHQVLTRDFHIESLYEPACSLPYKTHLVLEFKKYYAPFKRGARMYNYFPVFAVVIGTSEGDLMKKNAKAARPFNPDVEKILMGHDVSPFSLYPCAIKQEDEVDEHPMNDVPFEPLQADKAIYIIPPQLYGRLKSCVIYIDDVKIKAHTVVYASLVLMFVKDADVNNKRATQHKVQQVLRPLKGAMGEQFNNL